MPIKSKNKNTYLPTGLNFLQHVIVNSLLIFCLNKLGIASISVHILIYSYFTLVQFTYRIWNEFSFHTVFMKLVCFISPCQRLGDITTHTSFHKYRMKWILDSFYHMFNSQKCKKTDLSSFINSFTAENTPTPERYLCYYRPTATSIPEGMN